MVAGEGDEGGGGGGWESPIFTEFTTVYFHQMLYEKGGLNSNFEGGVD
jgi:hypothetical protein